MALVEYVRVIIEEDVAIHVRVYDLLDHPPKRNVRECMLCVVRPIATTDICVPSTYHSRIDLNVSKRTRMASSKPDLFDVRFLGFLIGRFGPRVGNIRIRGCR